MTTRPTDEAVVKVQIIYYRLLDNHGRPFRDKEDRLEFNRRFYLLLEKRHKDLKSKTLWKNCVHSAWRNLKRDSYPSFIRQGEPALQELFRRIWKIYHQKALTEAADNAERLGDNIRPSLPLSPRPFEFADAHYEEIKTRAEEIQKVTMSEENPPGFSDNRLDEYHKMKQDIMEKRSQLCKTIEKNLDLLKFYEEMNNRIEACRPPPSP